MKILQIFLKTSFILCISKILGFLRDFMISNSFKIGIETDSFFIIFKFINFLKIIFSENLFFQLFFPSFSKSKRKLNHHILLKEVSVIVSNIIFILAIFTLLGVIFAKCIVTFTVPGIFLNSEKYKLTTLLLRVMFPYFFFTSITIMISFIFKMCNFIMLSNYSSILFNIFTIIFIFFFSYFSKTSIIFLAISMILGSILQLLFYILQLKKIGLKIKVKINVTYFKKNFFLFLKAILNSSIFQVSNLLNIMFISFLSPKSITYIYYIDRLISLPSGIFGTTLGNLMFPYLSKYIKEKNEYKYFNLINKIIKICLIFSLPIMVIIMTFSKNIVEILFNNNQFNKTDIIFMKKTLFFYTITILGSIFSKIFTFIFLSLNKRKELIKIIFLSSLANQFINLLLFFAFGYYGMIFSLSITSLINSYLLFTELKKFKVFIFSYKYFLFILKLIIGVLSMIIFNKFVLTILFQFFKKNFFPEIIILFITLIINSIIYFSTLKLLKIPFRKIFKV